MSITARELRAHYSRRAKAPRTPRRPVATKDVPVGRPGWTLRTDQQKQAPR